MYELQIEPDFGFNKGQTILLQVGQLINKRSLIYATGELSLQAS